MLPFVLVLLVASSAYALPAVSVIPYSINEIPATPDNGGLVNKFITKGALEYIDTGDVSLYGNVLLESINSLAGASDSSSQAAAVLQTISVLGELANGVPGDSCQSASVINAFLSGNGRSAAANYARQVARYIDTIVALIVNPNAVRFSSGSKGNCISGGRTYDIESAWEAISNSANVANSGLLNESYCSAKRLYSANTIVSNNLASAVTAATLPSVNQAAQRALVPLAQFLRVVASGGNPSQAAAIAKNAILQSA